MTPYFHDDWLTIYQGDVRAVLPELASESVDCIVTSPPYWGLRDYGTAAWSGGADGHEHVGQDLRTADVGGPKQQTKRGSIGVRSGDCECGATRSDGQIGLERTPEEYVANLVGIFRELRRVLKASGTCWLNLGDSFASGSTPHSYDGMPEHAAKHRGGSKKLAATTRPQRQLGGLKPKDLVGIPWRVAFALQADGWYLRSDIIWAKPNPMPESVTDRPTKAHEYLFLLTKSARYYYDAVAVAERAQLWSGRAGEFGRDGLVSEHVIPGQTAAQHRPRTNGKHSTQDPQAAGRRIVENVKAARAEGNDHDSPFGPTRNLRSVWTIATRPYPGAHFAVFPPELPERCIKAGSSERGVCPECGAPWERIVELGAVQSTGGGPGRARPESGVIQDLGDYNSGQFVQREHVTTGWQSSCGHGVEIGSFAHNQPQPAVILDPFAGSGTTGMVANRLSRRAILVDLNGDYLKQQLQRNAQTPLGLGAA